MRLPLILALLALPAFAETAPDPGPATASPGTVARLIEAHRLYQLGQTAQDPLLVFAAARLMQRVTLREVVRIAAEPVPDASPLPRPADKVVPDPARAAPLPAALNPQSLMAEARAMTPDNDLLRDVIAQAETEVPPPGPVAEVTSLVQPAGEKSTFSIPVAGGTYSEVGLLRLSGDGADDSTAQGHLTLTVTDALGKPVCQDVSASASVLCGIVPQVNGMFRVSIANDGPAPAAYVLITN